MVSVVQEGLPEHIKASQERMLAGLLQLQQDEKDSEAKKEAERKHVLKYKMVKFFGEIIVNWRFDLFLDLRFSPIYRAPKGDSQDQSLEPQIRI